MSRMVCTFINIVFSSLLTLLVSTGGDACIFPHVSAGASESSGEALDSFTIATEERSERKRGMRPGTLFILFSFIDDFI